MKNLFNIFIILLVLFFLSNLPVLSQLNNFVEKQKEFPKVKSAYDEKETEIKATLAELGLKLSEIHILITAYKNEKELDLWVKRKSNKKYNLMNVYKICSTSGKLGPKRREGDLQIPEGFYHINVFNPTSNFYLSMGINYPNRSDRILSPHQNPGGEIFIHGACATIGCLPMTDDIIKELYIYAVEAKNNGQINIPVYIFPLRLDQDNYEWLKDEYKHNIDLLKFWSNIRDGYERFLSNNEQLNIKFNSDGKYLFD